MGKTVVIVGGGFAGAYLARDLERGLPEGWELILFGRENFVTFTPMLAEVVGSAIDPLHVVRPVRQFLRRTRCRTAPVTALQLDARRVEYRLPGGRSTSQPYDHLVLACGMVVNADILPGAAAHAFPLKTLGDAIALRNHVLTQLERAEVETDLERRRHLLSFAVIGGGFSGVEVTGQIYDLLADSLRFYPSLRRDELRVEILHGSKQILPELPESLGDYARRRMQARGIAVRLDARAKAVSPGGVTLADGSHVAAGTVVCTIGNTVSPLMAASGLPLERKRLRTEPDMRVPGHPGVWALGDCALVPNAHDGKPSPTLAQFALRQAKQLAENLKREAVGRPTRPFSFRMQGSLAAIGHRDAVAQVFGLKFSGFLAWFLWRGVYLGKMPTLARKVQIAFDWAWDLFFPRDIVQLDPRETGRVPRAHYEPGEYVFREGDPADKLYVIERGRAGVYQGAMPGPVATLGPGDRFGVGALLGSENEPVSLRAEEPLDVLVVGREPLRDLARHLGPLRADLQDGALHIESARKLLDAARDDPGLNRLRVRDAVSEPARTLPSGTPLAEAVDRVRREGVADFVIVDDRGRLQGTCTAADLGAALCGRNPPNTPLAEVMSRPARVVTESTPLVEAMLALLEQPVKPLVVVADDDATRPIGLLTSLDVLLHYARSHAPGAD